MTDLQAVTYLVLPGENLRTMDRKPVVRGEMCTIVAIIDTIY